MGLETVLGLRRQGFFIPYRYARSVPDVAPVYEEFETFLRGHEPAFEAVLAHERYITERIDDLVDGEALGQCARQRAASVHELTAVCAAELRLISPRSPFISSV